jgi:LDH2 family malate/lactate/ureidoglycolate dehydrogenase
VQGMHFAVEKARTFGIGICLAARTSHWGRAHAYAYRAAREDMIGLCTTNSMPSMFLPGSIRSVLGNNPLAIASPRGFGRDPIVLDMALTQAAVGKIATYLREGKDVPLGWGLDESGQPTRNAAAILASRKFLPMGGYKGYGLCLMMEILTAVLAGGLLGFEILRADSSSLDPDSSKLFVAVNIEAFGDKDSFFRKSDLLLQNLCDAADSGEDVLFPGERGWRTRDRYLLEGIPIHPEIVNQLRAIGMPI